MSASVDAFIALGSNLQDREANLLSALDALNANPQVEVVGCSAIYETAPVGFVHQPSFLNMAARIRTVLNASELLQTLLNTEQAFGRKRDIHWGPRTLDLDLLIFGNEQINTPSLTLPHPRMLERAFVLIPLSDLIRQKSFAGSESILETLEKLGGKEDVVLWKRIKWPNASGHFVN